MKAGELLNLDNVLLGFIRPRSPDEWQLAYLQSQLSSSSSQKKYGDKAIGSLLADSPRGSIPGGPGKGGRRQEPTLKGIHRFLEARVKEAAAQQAARS